MSHLAALNKNSNLCMHPVEAKLMSDHGLQATVMSVRTNYVLGLSRLLISSWSPIVNFMPLPLLFGGLWGLLPSCFKNGHVSHQVKYGNAH